MASTSKGGDAKKGKGIRKRLPFLRAGEESNISPSKFGRVLQYLSENEMSELEDEFESDDEFMIDDPEPLGVTDESEADITDSSSESSSLSDSDSWESDLEGDDDNQPRVTERGRGEARGRQAGGRRGRARVLSEGTRRKVAYCWRL